MGNFQNTGSINVRVQGRKKRRGGWILLAAVLSVAVFCILAFWKPGFGWKWFDKEATLEKGVIELDELSFDFSASDMRDGSVSLRKDHMSDELDQEGLVSDLYEMTIDGECNDPVTVTMKVPDEYTGKDGQTLMLAIGTDNDVCIDADTDRHYYYVKAEVKGDTATAVFVPEEVFESRLLYRKDSGTVQTSDNSTTSGNKYTPSRVIRFGETLRNWVSDENPRFLISYPYLLTVSDADTKAFIRDLEDMWDWYAAQGYSFEGLQPLTIYVINGSDNDVDAAFSRSWEGPQIEFRKKFIFGTSNTSDYSGTNHLARPLMYHEFFHAIQDQYVGQNKHTLWFDEATATYYEHSAEKRFGISNIYKFAKTTEENYRLALESVIPRDKKIADIENRAESTSIWKQITENLKNKRYSLIGDEGYARGPFCDIVSEVRGSDEWIRNVYENWKDNGVSDFKDIEKIADGIPNLAVKLYQRFINGTYTETGYTPLTGRAYYYINTDVIDVSDADLEALRNGTQKSIIFTGSTRTIYGQGAIVSGLKFRNLNQFGGDVKYNISISVKGQDLVFETYELWEYDALPFSGNYIRDIYQAMKNDKKRFATLIVSKKPFNSEDKVTITYEITVDAEKKKAEATTQDTQESTEEGTPALPEDKGYWQLVSSESKWNGVNTEMKWSALSMTHAEFSCTIGNKNNGTEREFNASFDWTEPYNILKPGEEYLLSWSVNSSEKLEYYHDCVPYCSYDWDTYPTWSRVAEISGKKSTILTPFQKNDEAKTSDSGVAVLTVKESRSSSRHLCIEFHAQYRETYWDYEWVEPQKPTETTEESPIESLGTYDESKNKSYTVYDFNALGALLEDDYSIQHKYEDVAKSIEMRECIGKTWSRSLTGSFFSPRPEKMSISGGQDNAISLDAWVEPGESAVFYGLYTIEGTKYGNIAGLITVYVVNRSDTRDEAYDCEITDVR